MSSVSTCSGIDETYKIKESKVYSNLRKEYLANDEQNKIYGLNFTTVFVGAPSLNYNYEITFTVSNLN